MSSVMLDLHVSWWVRPLMKLVFCWCRLTGREPDYDTLAQFAVKHGMKIKVTDSAIG